MQKIKIRLFSFEELKVQATIALNEQQSHYLNEVMKCKIGDSVLLFDAKNGEFSAKLIEQKKKTAILQIMEKTRDFYQVPDLWLLFAPLKKDNTDFVIQKATELGVRRIIPTITKNTITDKIKKERFIAQSIEAAEQSRRVDLPEICDALSLEKLLQNWDSSRTLFFMDESLQGEDIAKAFANSSAKAAILCGPEGGFSEEEKQILRTKEYVKSINLGPRILRAETAAITALACWQAICGDWKKGE